MDENLPTFMKNPPPWYWLLTGVGLFVGMHFWADVPWAILGIAPVLLPLAYVLRVWVHRRAYGVKFAVGYGIAMALIAYGPLFRSPFQLYKLILLAALAHSCYRILQYRGAANSIDADLVRSNDRIAGYR